MRTTEREDYEVTENAMRGVRQLAWWLCVALWTIGLLTSTPAHVSGNLFSAPVGFSISKTVHVAAYAFLCSLIPFLGVRGWPLLVFLSLHAGATEFLQQWVPDRHGSLRDVGLDHLGLVLGLALSWRWWRPATPASQSLPLDRTVSCPLPAAATATTTATE